MFSVNTYGKIFNNFNVRQFYEVTCKELSKEIHVDLKYILKQGYMKEIHKRQYNSLSDSHILFTDKKVSHKKLFSLNETFISIQVKTRVNFEKFREMLEEYVEHISTCLSDLKITFKVYFLGSESLGMLGSNLNLIFSKMFFFSL